MSAADRLTEIAARADAATEGPWREWTGEHGVAVETAWSHDEDGADTDLITDWCKPADATFIAAARTDVPALVAALRAVHQVAFDPDTTSALEHGVVGTPPNVEGLTVSEALGYAIDALRDIRATLNALDAP
jgi:hypothetical protein